jgi:hypothetical protein
MNELLSMIGNVGFPIAVSVYLLIRVETKLGDLTGAIGELREAIITLPQNKYWSASPSPSSYPVTTQPTQTEYV